MLKIKKTLLSIIFFLIYQILTFEAFAALKCSKLYKTATGEQLINSCNTCRIVKVQRKRPSANAPIHRTYTLPQNTTTTLSFRGPGHSRIISDTVCQPFSSKMKKNSVKRLSKKVNERCILMQRTEKGGITGLALANTCNKCRIVLVDRIDERGSRRSQNVVISGNSIVPLPSKGATQAGIISEKSCK